MFINATDIGQIFVVYLFISIMIIIISVAEPKYHKCTYGYVSVNNVNCIGYNDNAGLYQPFNFSNVINNYCSDGYIDAKKVCSECIIKHIDNTTPYLCDSVHVADWVYSMVFYCIIGGIIIIISWIGLCLYEYNKLKETKKEPIIEEPIIVNPLGTADDSRRKRKN